MDAKFLVIISSMKEILYAKNSFEKIRKEYREEVSHVFLSKREYNEKLSEGTLVHGSHQEIITNLTPGCPGFQGRALLYFFA